VSDPRTRRAPERLVAIVTGGASGIGLAIARRLAEDGAAVAVLDLNGEAAEEAAASITADGHEARGLEVDVCDRARVEAATAEVAERMGPATILVNNAGRENFSRFLSIAPRTFADIIEVNLTGTFHCCQAAIPAMVEAGWGRIVNISSSSAQGGQPYMAAYVSAKAGVIGLTKSLALEFGPDGITVNTIPPAFVDTPMLRKSEAKGLLGKSVEDHEEATPVRRVGTPEDIAAATAFLVREDAGYVTGQVIGVNGGRVTG
jgi:2-hydroxycyclohexanecarboxyl-CoA dehydrogenase